MAGMAQVTHRHSCPGATVEQQQAHHGHQTEDLLGPVRGLAEEDHERCRGADEKCPPGYDGPRRDGASLLSGSSPWSLPDVTQP